ncbi:MAG: 5-formyltetrahydrofolate cyclo-ligase [Chlorobi bacterium]|nr:MAG: 5-formyltetrahydrofolate cyclo-ligase [Bacteroidota bacterium]MBE2265534.1 5-formyltetrahydrofolate cyclo-ligase [Flavobacteriales bacterium]MBL1160702.1 5-formyltetrahydrofolate cyclo-ligase [Chlorobiota bacterium]MBW7853053.1 5-formyltetrahydrofolate cyclo-ligase [Candidatus Kapabacteria bacterium]MCC6331458.1 5-formyltetrahydrofolate cyclo-ligase [Ignavibacteria bacterium]
MTKDEIRAAVRTKRSAMTAQQKETWDLIIFERAHKQRAFQLAKAIHVYMSTSAEIQTNPFIEYAWGTGKDVYVPVMIGSADLTHVKVSRDTEWSTGSHGIPEPIDVRESVQASFFDPTCCIVVPVVAFNEQCDRLGYGKGYYDRFLSQADATKIGLAYEFQKTPQMPVDEHDVPLDCIATEERWYKKN